MNQAHPTVRFRTNPVEIMIFLTISGIFIFSLYNLFYGHPDFQLNTLSTMSANPISEGRSLASVAPSLTTFEVSCDKNPTKMTPSNKVRLSGILCGGESERSNRILVRADITNTTNQFNATLFTDTDKARFSTDYIPLNPGPNSLHIIFSYQDGATFSQDLSIIKN